MLINKLNRRTMLLGGFAGIALLHLLVGIAAVVLPDSAAKPYVVLVLVVSFVFVMQGTIGATRLAIVGGDLPVKDPDLRHGALRFRAPAVRRDPGLGVPAIRRRRWNRSDVLHLRGNQRLGRLLYQDRGS